jgi:hypothetical protein
VGPEKQVHGPDLSAPLLFSFVEVGKQS